MTRNLVWIDCEMTGLDIGADALIVRHPASGSALQIAGWVAPGGAELLQAATRRMGRTAKRNLDMAFSLREA